jgi:drug/metabolite transporter (DMT)-like permease
MDHEGGGRWGTEAVGGALIGLASLQFGMVVILGDLVLEEGLPVYTMLAFRFAIAAAVLAAVLGVLRHPLLPARGERAGLAALAVAGYAVEASFFFAAIDHGRVAAVTLLFFTYPVLVTVGSLLLGQGAPGGLVLTSLLFALAGVAIVVATSGTLVISGIGIMFALLSAVTFAAYLLGADRVLRATPALSGSMWVAAWASAALALLALATGDAGLPHDGAEWLRLAGMGAFTAGAFVCLFGGLSRLGPVRTSIVAASEPLSATLLAFLFLGQEIVGGVALGGVLILAGAVAASLARARPGKPPTT